MSTSFPAGAAAVARPGVPANAANNIFWLVAERTLKAVGGVAIAVLIARHLGPAHYGQYGAAIGLATLAKEAVMLGFDRMIRRDLAARPGDAGRIVGTSVALGLVLALAIALCLTALSGRIVEDPLTRQLTLIVIWMALPQAFFACEIWFESAGMTRPLVWTRNVVWTLALAARLVLVFTHAGVMAFAIVALLEWIATYAAVCWLLRRLHGGELRPVFDAAQLRAWFREGRPIVIMAVMNSAAERLMVLLAQNLAPAAAEAGYLSAATRITDIWWSISTIIAAVLLPRMVRLQQVRPGDSEAAMQRYADVSLLVPVAAAVAVSLTAPFLVPLVFGAAYAPAAQVLAVVCWAGLAIFPAVSRAQALVSRSRLALDLPSVATIAVLQLGLATVLIPRYGALGAGVAITAANWLGFYGLALAVPGLRRASQPQFRAFRALLRPWRTVSGVREYAKKMLKA